MIGEQDRNGESVTRIERFPAPWGREITLDNVDHESGMRMLRITIREGRRFTIFDLDSERAAHLGAALTNWAGQDETVEK